MALMDTIKRLIRLVHDPVDYPPAPTGDASTRRERARAETEASRQSGSLG